jgi:hypothetical protein
MEQQSVNNILYSSQFDNAYWTKTNLSITENANIAPDGTLTADLITNNSTNGEHRFFNATPMTLATARTISIYAKAGSASFIGLTPSGVTTSYAVFDLGTGAVSSVVGGTATINAVGNGWYRCVYYASSSTSNTWQYIVVNLGETAAQAVTGTSYVGTNKNAYVWGAQAELGTFSTSYIPTGASEVTRAQDFATISGTNFSSWFNNQQGTVYCSFDVATISASANNMALWGIDNNTTLGYLMQRQSGASLFAYQNSGATFFTMGTIPSVNTTQQSIYTFNNTSGSLGFSGTLNEFIDAVEKTHGDNKFGKEYKLLIEVIKFKFTNVKG